MTPEFVAEIVEKLMAAPEVSKPEALKLVDQILDRSDYLECLIEIIGFGTTCDSSSANRKFIAYIAEHGPIVKGE